MPIPLIVAGVAAAGSAIAGLIEAGSIVATLAGIGLIVWRVYVFVTLVWAAFWFACAAFAKEILTWFMELYFKLVSFALESVGMPDVFSQFATLVSQLPPKLLELFAWLGLWENASAMLMALFVNWGLRSLPLVGHLFRG